MSKTFEKSEDGHLRITKQETVSIVQKYTLKDLYMKKEAVETELAVVQEAIDQAVALEIPVEIPAKEEPAPIEEAPVKEKL